MNDMFPGQSGARAAGCKCPVVDNRHRDWRFAVMRQDCPLHGWDEKQVSA